MTNLIAKYAVVIASASPPKLFCFSKMLYIDINMYFDRSSVAIIIMVILEKYPPYDAGVLVKICHMLITRFE